MEFKFRAECKRDVLIFRDNTIGLTENFEITPQEIDGSQIPDVDVIFESELSLDEIIDEMRKVFDGHVMLQTVKPIQDYTGERDYNLE